MKKFAYLIVLLVLFSCQVLIKAQVDARIMQYPDVSKTQIVFAYAGDLWVVSKDGGVANRLTTPPGPELFPKFSPDGSHIAFSGNYEGNLDVYVIPSEGGLPVRVTHQGMPDRMVCWYPDGKHLLYASSMESGKQRFDQFYKVSPEGGMPEKLIIPYGEFASLSPDGKSIAYTPKSRAFRTWKRYRGGWAADIWVFNFETGTAQNITVNPANDEFPMWHGKTIYFLSDRGKDERANIWSYNLDTKQTKQITNFTDFDVHFPSLGTDDIVFEAGGKLYLLDLATEKYNEVKVEVVTDELTLMPKTENVDKKIESFNLSPDGKRGIFEARGDLFSVPAEKGNVVDLTNTSGYAERYPSWSPDGKSIAYWSDKSGEYELTLKNMENPLSKEKKLTSYGPGFRYQIYWSPDSKKVAFIDKAMNIFIYNTDNDKTTKVDKEKYFYEGNLENFTPSWSSDSRYLAYQKDLDNLHSAIYIYDTKEEKANAITKGYYNDYNPYFDPEGKYLYYLTDRTMKALYSGLQNTFIYANPTKIAAVTLTSTEVSPTAPQNDTVAFAKDTSMNKEKSKKDKEKKEVKSKEVKIDFSGILDRSVILPPEAGNYGNLQAVSGKVIYIQAPNTGSAEKKKAIKYYDLTKREEKTIADGVNGYTLSADGKKILIVKDGSYYVTDIAPEQKLEKKMPTDQMEMTINPRQEWHQIFNDVWRFERDFFYDPNMHGVNWNEMRERYGKLIDYAVTRWDVNYIIGELIGEISSSHTYVGGGDVQQSEKRAVGYLGVDWELSNGAYRIKKIIKSAPWDVDDRSPLDQPGVNVKEGDYILAVNGVPMDAAKDPWAAFQGLAGKTVELTVNSKPSMEGAREVFVETMKDETRLRNLAWIEANRKLVEKQTDG
ncbi:MAG TPA: PDZ domain-containing protein, partial [Ignavibacteriaceae bacterium]|nr:PDZ domain-containing protein [Ignavibacteriaceae bacterium]